MTRSVAAAIRVREKRCAIYTRKSTEEGLDQEFNSLDAQREACAAYILSQRHEGWMLVPEHYDDGGFTGGNMERPGLRQLLADVKAGRVDIILVYKVDRLTRALSDFAKIVDVLDAAGASFVSITQAFNTTTSMGRLTLNVLLSFAQFEREVISERVRDKIAASKRKGMWMGGNVPLGYDVVDRKLVINPKEADTIRYIFERYFELGSVAALISDLTEKQIGTKAGRRGSRRLGRGGLYHILSNRIYRGEIAHKGEAYTGEHAAIIDDDLWDRVQALLSANAVDRQRQVDASAPSLLAGMIEDGQGRRMAPSHATKGSLRYRYYVSVNEADRSVRALRLPARPIERVIIEGLVALLAEQHRLLDLVRDATPDQTARLVQGIQHLRKRITSHPSCAYRAMLLDLKLKVIIDQASIAATVDASSLLIILGARPEDRQGERLVLPIDATPERQDRGVRLMVTSGADDGFAVRDARLIELLLRARDAYRQVMAGEHRGEQPVADNRSKYLVRQARLVFLAPDIVAAILEGRQPPSLNARRLSRIPDLPLSWAEQRQFLGFA